MVGNITGDKNGTTISDKMCVKNLVKIIVHVKKIMSGISGTSTAAATSKMNCFVIIVNGWKPLTIITKQSILDVAAALDPSTCACECDKD